MKHDGERFELGESLIERLLGLVLVVGERREIGQPKVSGVGEAGAHHAAVAGRDRLAAVRGDQVGNENEAIGEFAGGVRRHEAFLIGADRRADDLRRNVEKGRLEFAHQHDRPFDQAGDFLEQALVLDEFEALREGEAAARRLRIIALRRSASRTTLALNK